ncbi:FTR1 family iron permease [Gephyromycinifex aptenodytis]|uniref:FTR1 family iron permease n=1 Tax=Gephyromycinifex aptenodytis TaxID=2716227 RepID=UPI001B2FE67E|nr:FTR1 family protein [Gephyromycinifex aptenodytis]
MAIVVLVAAFCFCAAPLAQGAEQPKGEWGTVATEVVSLLDQAVDSFEKGNTDEAKSLVKKARYDVFAGKGLEEQIATQVSGADASKANMDFGLLTKAITEKDADAVKAHAEALESQLTSDAKSLDGGSVNAADLKVSPGKWGQTASTMVGLLDDALKTYEAGDAEGGKNLVNEAYYGHYEITGFEKMTMAQVSGGRVAAVELEFALIKKAMSEGKGDEVARRIQELKPQLIEDANTLDGFDGTGEGKTTQTSGTTIFFASFTVILREGIEAMLVVAAVVAYLVKAGHKEKTKVVWAGAAAALVVSVLLAFLISTLTGLAGKGQELMEGITALVAVAMLIYVSNWMLGKSEAAAWNKFIKDKTETSLGRGSLLSLAFVAFLAVVREGAETILFYQPILSMAQGDTRPVWFGLGVGILVLLVVYALIRALSIRIPLRPFFLATSLLLAILALTFTGSGIGELQEADVVSVTPIAGIPTIDLLGIYPRVENLAAQALVLALMIGLFIYGSRRNNRLKASQ